MSSQPDLQSSPMSPLSYQSATFVHAHVFTDSWMLNESDRTNKNMNKAENKHQLRHFKTFYRLIPLWDRVGRCSPPRAPVGKLFVHVLKLLSKHLYRTSQQVWVGTVAFSESQGTSGCNALGCRRTGPILSSNGGQCKSQAHASIWKVPINAPMEEEVRSVTCRPTQMFSLLTTTGCCWGGGCFRIHRLDNTTQQVYQRAL